MTPSTPHGPFRPGPLDSCCPQNLNNLIPAGSPYSVTNVTAINDNGQIVATDIPQVFLLTPG